jgi:carotenoid cleavage dioxygenase-like enzyme
MQTQPRNPTQDLFAQGKPLWARAIAQPAQEFAPTALRLISGHLPPGLRGTLYRNGPARLERQGKRVAHWFDGDGAILAVHFTDAGVTGLYRYVKTKGFLAEEQAGRFLYSGYGQLAPGPFWNRWGAKTKNVANTSVIALPDKLLALWEGDKPHALDLETLETLGPDDLTSLKGNLPYSAHPKRDPTTGEIYNFGVTFGTTAQINLYRSDARGQIRQQRKIPLERLSLVHDFALAGPYLIFLVPPLQMQPLSVLLGFKSFSAALQWQPQYGTQIIVVDRQTFQEVKRFDTDPWFQWHIGNGYTDEDGSVVIDFVRYPDFQTNQWLQEFVTGYPRTPAVGRLWRIRLQPKTGKVLENYQQLNLHGDLPIVSPLESGKQAQYLYLITQSSSESKTEELYNSIARVDLETGTAILAEPGPGCYPMEPIYAPDQFDPKQGWILTVVFNGNQAQSTVQIYQAQHLNEGPVCVLELPQIIPFGFHGTWHPTF